MNRSFILLLSLLSFNVFASVVHAPQQKITNLRVESYAGLIGFSINPSDTDCINRYWVDLRDEVEKVKFSVAMMAFASGKKVILRANPLASKVYGACKLYDIYVVE